MERSDYAIVVTTLPSEEEALNLAEHLVDARLAACVHISPIRSIYRWEGHTVKEKEYRLEIKTRRFLFEKIEAYLKNRHPYDIPEIILLPIETCSKSYGEWIGDSIENF